MSQLAPADFGATDPPLPAPVADTVARWRAAMVGAQPDVAQATLRRAAIQLWRTAEVAATTVHSGEANSMRRAIADELNEMAIIGEIDTDSAQSIIAGAKESSALDDDDLPVDLPPEPPQVSIGDAYGVKFGSTELDDPPGRFTPVAIDDVEATAAPAWLVRQLLPARGLACVVGPPKSGKSFLTTDMLFSVARGTPYAGRATLSGPVIYLTGEGVMGFKRRLIAMRRHHDVEGQGVPFFMIENVPDLGSERTDVHDLLGELDRFIADRSLDRPRALVLDTLARCMGEGDENSARDMGRFVNRCGIIERHFKCAVVVVHHMGKNPAAGGRGSNALNGATDVTLTVEKAEAYSTVRIDEMKDGPEGQEWRFRLLPYDLGETFPSTETSTETSTCIVELLSEPTQTKHSETKAAKPLRGVNGDLLKVIRRAVQEAGEINTESVSVPNNVRAVRKKSLRNYCTTMDWQEPEKQPDAFRSALSRGLSDLRSRSLVGFDREWVWLT